MPGVILSTSHILSKSSYQLWVGGLLHLVDTALKQLNDKSEGTQPIAGIMGSMSMLYLLLSIEYSEHREDPRLVNNLHLKCSININDWHRLRGVLCGAGIWEKGMQWLIGNVCLWSWLMGYALDICHLWPQVCFQKVCFLIQKLKLTQLI